MAHLAISRDSLTGLVKRYFHGELGGFYSQRANRLMLYPFLAGFFFVECLTFWLLFQGTEFFLNYMAFTTVYSLHKALVYTLCMLAADMAAHWLLPAWGAYGRRTVGRQWLIWGVGIAVGFVLQRSIIGRLIILYAPEVIRYFMNHPQERIGNATLLLIMAPYWATVVFFTLQVAKSKQRDRQQAAASPPVKPRGLPSGSLKLDNANGNGLIALAEITHVTVEDHYCRVSYCAGNGLKSALIRMQLKEMLGKLPPEHFVQIHRSHVVNLGHVSRLAKKGRDHKVLLKRHEVELPVSRSRFKQLRPWLVAAGFAG